MGQFFSFAQRPDPMAYLKNARVVHEGNLAFINTRDLLQIPGAKEPINSEINAVFHFERGVVKRFVSYAEVERLRECVLTNANKPIEAFCAAQANSKRASGAASGTTPEVDRRET